MSKRKKAAANAANIDNGRSGKRCSPNPAYYSTTRPGMPQAPFSISVHLSGREHSISGRRLSERLGMDQRKLVQLIREERLRGVPICSTPAGGYWLASSSEELYRCARSMFHRGRECFSVAKALVRTAERLRNEVNDSAEEKDG